MINEILMEIRNKFDDGITVINNKFMELEELKKDSKVQRYIELANLKEIVDSLPKNEVYDEFINSLAAEFGNGYIKDTNDILVFMGEEPNTSLYSETQNTQSICIYLDLENAQRKIIVPSSDRKHFEENYKYGILYGDPAIKDNYLRYIMLRTEFFQRCLFEGQEPAVKHMLSLYKK